MTRLCGRRYERQPRRTHTRYGHQRGTATLAGQKIAIARSRVRRTDGGGEVPLETYARLQSPEAMPEAVLRRMVRGVSTRDYADVIDLTRDGFGVEKSSLVQTRVTLGGVKPSTTWPESPAPTSVTDGLARPFIEESVTLAPCDLNQARNRASVATSSGPPRRKSKPWRNAVSKARTSRRS